MTWRLHAQNMQKMQKVNFGIAINSEIWMRLG